jgi:hypothetical protein
MNGKMICKLASTMMLTVLVMGVAGQTVAEIVNSQNFNSYSSGQSLADAGWYGSGASSIKFSAAPFDAANESGLDAAGNYVDGRTDANSRTAFYDVGYHNTGLWTLRADLKFTGSGTSLIGFSDSNPDLHTGTPGLGPIITAIVQNPYNSSKYADSTSGLYSDWYYANGGYGVDLPYLWSDAGTSGSHIEIVMDYDNHQMKATNTSILGYAGLAAGESSTTGWLPMLSWTTHQNDLYGFDRLMIYNSGGSNGSIQVDNIAIYSGTIPEPSTSVLLVTGVLGLLVYAGRKWKTV